MLLRAPQRIQHCSTAQNRTFWNCSSWMIGKYQTKRTEVWQLMWLVQWWAVLSSPLDLPSLLCSIVSRKFAKLSSNLAFFKVQILVSKSSRKKFQAILVLSWRSKEKKIVSQSTPGDLRRTLLPTSDLQRGQVSFPTLPLGIIAIFWETSKKLVLTKIWCGLKYECPSNSHKSVFSHKLLTF